jgi:hypothetical protein
MLTLRLPFWLAERYRLETVLRRSDHPDRHISDFALSGPERVFARDLLRQRRNLWLWRTNQRARCGDFVVVDMSEPRPERRVARVIELKMSKRLGPGGYQTLGAQRLMGELPAGRVVCVSGDAPAVRDWLSR